jgi:hypothetical protein
MFLVIGIGVEVFTRKAQTWVSHKLHEHETACDYELPFFLLERSLLG